MDAMHTQHQLAAQIEAAPARRATKSSKRSSRAKRRGWPMACREMSERFLRGGRLARVRPRPLRHRRAACLRGIRPSGHRRQARPARRSISRCLQPWLEAIVQPGRHRDGLRSARGRPRSLAARCDAARSRGAHDLRALPGIDGSYAFDAVDRRSLHASGNDRDPLSHALGNGACLLRASRTRARRRRMPDFSIRSSGRQKQDTDDRDGEVAASIR